MVRDPRRDRVDPREVLRHLRAERGIRSVLCEGGPHVCTAQLAGAGPVDELFLTIAPKLAGGEAPRILEGALPDVASSSWSGCSRQRASCSPATGRSLTAVG